MVFKLVIAFGLIVILFLGYVALRPSDFRVERSITVNAPAEAVFPNVNDLRKMNVWNPFPKQDPNIKLAYEGPGEGVGSRSSWEGNANVGQGSMTIIESAQPSLIRIRLDFIKPFPGTNLAEFSFKPEGSQTVVSWSMTGQLSFLPKIFSVFISMDKMIGNEFDKGLAQLKSISETSAK